MALYRITPEVLEPVSESTFVSERLLERRDLQRLLRNDISVLDADLMVVAEEFGDWEESGRRIDLLCLDRQGRLVVIEIKRTEDGGHMELQAIRYAAMISSMTFDQLAAAHARYLGNIDTAHAATQLQTFLSVDDIESPVLQGDVRVFLVAQDFSREITTTVLWLNRHDLDITCIRLQPYRLGEELLVDVQQIIPLPEAADYETRIRAREQENRRVRSARERIFLAFWSQLIERAQTRTPLLADRAPTKDHWLACGIGRGGFSLTLVLRQDDSQVECFVRPTRDPERNRTAFTQLQARRSDIEAAFGEPLLWEESRRGGSYRVFKTMGSGWHAPESEWPSLQDQMLEVLVRLEKALREPIQALDF